MSLKNNTNLGQHWLYDREVLDEIARLAHEGVESTMCLEIGPGLGTLTAALFRKFDKVLAVEYDAELARKLPGSFPGKNLEVVNQDFLQYKLSDVPTPYVAAGNIPYYITSPIIEKLLMARNQPERIVLLMQKEVAERIVDRRETLLSLRCKNRADVELGPVVLRDKFTPPPEVDSQVVVFYPHAPILPEWMFKFIATGFSQPRKKVTRNLSAYMLREDIKDIFIRNNINIDIRPAEVHLDDWRRIYELLKPYLPNLEK
ncbi:ribosomal RNA small subunit methyltransferase A [Candidatus Saccharibacteria bacterium]|nr:ribosomal RNA small subunit methyltransferase A [Candidatus Saccharibacteria bacterium]